MYISRVLLNNFKGYKGEHEFFFDEGINFLVGDNNCGKSTVFHAINFLLDGKNADEYLTKELDDEEFVSVEIELSGEDIPEFINQDHLKKYRNYVIDNGEEKCSSIRLLRSSKIDEVKQGGKNKQLSVKQIRIFNPKNEEFENPTGIDVTVKALFDTQFVWADTNTNDVLDFSGTKICGRIIKDIVTRQNQDCWSTFEKSHKETFQEIKKSLAPIETALQDKLAEQYGEAEVNFQFILPQLADFLKSGNIELTENGIKTSREEKGTGMQRSLALALIQVYADMVSSVEGKLCKPIFFFLDEPEIFLHPRAQDKLIASLEKLSKHSQIFIITHSPYLLRKYKKETHSLWLLSKKNGYNENIEGEELNLFGDSSPTWGEINYYAYNVLSVEFHNELYGFAQAAATLINEKNYYSNDFDDYLVSTYGEIKKNKSYIKKLRDGNTVSETVTLPTYIRNIIHHPENTENDYFSNEDLARSIKWLIEVIKMQKDN